MASINLGGFLPTSGKVFTVRTNLGTFHLSRVGSQPNRPDYVIGISIQVAPKCLIEVEDIHPLQVFMQREITEGDYLRYGHYVDGKRHRFTANLGKVVEMYIDGRRVTANVG